MENRSFNRLCFNINKLQSLSEIFTIILNLTSTANCIRITKLGTDAPRAHTDGRCQQGQKKQLNPCHGKAEQALSDKRFSISTYIAICSDIIYDTEVVTCPMCCWVFQQYCVIGIHPFLQAVVISWWLLRDKKGDGSGSVGILFYYQILNQSRFCLFVL